MSNHRTVCEPNQRARSDARWVNRFRRLLPCWGPCSSSQTSDFLDRCFERFGMSLFARHTRQYPPKSYAKIAGRTVIVSDGRNMKRNTRIVPDGRNMVADDNSFSPKSSQLYSWPSPIYPGTFSTFNNGVHPSPSMDWLSANCQTRERALVLFYRCTVGTSVLAAMGGHGDAPKSNATQQGTQSEARRH